MSPRLKQYLRHLPALLGVVLLFGATYVVQREFRSLKLDDIAVALEAIPLRALAEAGGWTLLAYGVLTFYDRLGTIYAGRKVSYARVSFASFCAYALSHNLGFAAVSGAAVRYRLYAHWGLSPLQIAKVVGFCSLTFGLGGLVLGGTILFIEPGAVPFFGDRLPHAAMWAVGAAMWAIVAAYITLARILGVVRILGHRITLPGGRMAVLQVLVASIDVAVTAAIFKALLPPTPGLTFVRFLAVYLASYTAGLAANLPGGIGVFDSAMLLGLAPYLDPPQIVGAIVVFRLYYYVIPLFLAGSLFTGNEILLRGGGFLRGGMFARGRLAVSRWSEPDFAIAAATGVVAIAGAVLLTYGVLFPRPAFALFDQGFASFAVGAGQFVPSLIGAALLVMAAALSHRVTLAWWITLVLLVLAAAFTASQARNLWLPVCLLLAALMIAPFRGAFYRHASLISGPLEGATAVPLLALILCVLALSVFERHVRGIQANSWWALVLSPDVSNSVRTSIAATVAVALLAIWRLIRPGEVRFAPWDDAAHERYAELGGTPPAAADGLVWGEIEHAAIPFRRLDGILLGLGDPVGAETDRAAAVWRLRDLAGQEGRRTAIWKAGAGSLKLYEDIGLTPLPLDADGALLPDSDDPVPPETLYLCCVIERDLERLLPLMPLLLAAERPVAATTAMVR